jgi:hypothetical protein
VADKPLFLLRFFGGHRNLGGGLFIFGDWEMTLEECVSALQSAKVGVCSVTDTTWLSEISTIASIIASLAVIATAIFAWRQLHYLHDQIIETRTAVKDQIQASAKTNTLSSTLQMLMQMQINDHWRENRLKFVTLRDHPDGLKKHSLKSTDENLCVKSVLNQYELIAIGIHSEILDSKMFENYYRGTVLKDWLACAEFVAEERKVNNRFWVELQTLTKTFEDSLFRERSARH